MSGEGNGQQGQRPTRPRHKQSRSTAGQADESNPPQKQANGQKKSNRRNQARNTQAQPVWQDNAPPQLDGYFDDQGNFVVLQQMQATQTPGMFYINNMQQSQSVHHGTRSSRKHTQGKNVSQARGTGTPPHMAPENDHYFNAPPAQAMTPQKAAAYAGPTFHASPAANSLPMPKFFSKSVPNDPSQSSLQTRLEDERVADVHEDNVQSDTPLQVDAAPAIPIPERPTESPLDIFFKADREQKAQRQSTGATLTPPAVKSSGTNGFFNSEPRPNHFQSIYGGRNHHRHHSNGSGRDMFMMELDGKDGSQIAQNLSPPPPMPRLGTRSVSDQHLSMPGGGQGHAQKHQNPDVYAATQRAPFSHGAAHSQGPPLDSSYSPFNRAPVYYSQPSGDVISSKQHDGNSSGPNNLHYGNRNLSPLFQATNQSPAPRPGSGLRQEIHPYSPGQIGAVELPDNSSAFRNNGHKQTMQQPSTPHADERAMRLLQSQAPHDTNMPQIPLPRPSSGPQGHAASVPPVVTSPGAYGASTKSIEDDLKRMLKLTGGIK